MIQALQDKRNKAVADATALFEAVKAENRAMTSEDEQRFDALMAEAESLGAQISRFEKLATIQQEQDASRGRMVRGSETRSGGFDANDALRGWLLLGSDKQPNVAQLNAAAQAGLHGRTVTFNLSPDALRTNTDIRAWEQRAQSHNTTAGGFTVPTDFQRELEVALLDFGGMRQAASVIRTANGADLPWPLSNDTYNEGEIVGENTEVSEQDLVFGQQILKAHKYSSKMIRVPVELIQDSAINLGQEIGQRLGERIGRVTNRHFSVGTGTNQPRGMVTDATLGVTAASATAVTYEELVDLQHSVDAAYRKNAVWMFSDATLRELKKLRDDDGKLIWQQGMVGREPDTILGNRYIVNNDIADMGSNAKSILFGDMSKYKIRDVQDVVLVRLDERFAEFHQVAFLAFSRHDGLLLDAGTHPVKYLKNAA